MLLIYLNILTTSKTKNLEPLQNWEKLLSQAIIHREKIFNLLTLLMGINHKSQYPQNVAAHRMCVNVPFTQHLCSFLQFFLRRLMTQTKILWQLNLAAASFSRADFTKCLFLDPLIRAGEWFECKVTSFSGEPWCLFPLAGGKQSEQRRSWQSNKQLNYH